MARGVKKSIEEKIADKQSLILALETRIEKERQELETLVSEQKQAEVKSLYEFIKTENLTVDKATELLKEKLYDV